MNGIKVFNTNVLQPYISKCSFFHQFKYFTNHRLFYVKPAKLCVSLEILLFTILISDILKYINISSERERERERESQIKNIGPF